MKALEETKEVVVEEEYEKTCVTAAEINHLIWEAEQIDPDNVNVNRLLEWIEDAHQVFCHIVGDEVFSEDT